MRLPEQKFSDIELNKMYKKVQSVVNDLSGDNFTKIFITDETSATPNAERLFKHGLGAIPSFWMVLEGNAYIERGSVTEKEIDVRSSNASEPFRLLIIK